MIQDYVHEYTRIYTNIQDKELGKDVTISFKKRHGYEEGQEEEDEWSLWSFRALFRRERISQSDRIDE